jgi:hypothetical protein
MSVVKRNATARDLDDYAHTHVWSVCGDASHEGGSRHEQWLYFTGHATVVPSLTLPKGHQWYGIHKIERLAVLPVDSHSLHDDERLFVCECPCKG